MEEMINKIINADCMDILKKLPDNSVDLVLTDPPYLIKNTTAGGKTRENELDIVAKWEN